MQSQAILWLAASYT